MFKFGIAIYKEAIVLINDKAGLLFMFLLPLILVTVVTVVQNSAFELANKNRITLLTVNHDQSTQGAQLIALLDSSGMFRIVPRNDIEASAVAAGLKAGNTLSGIFIPPDFSKKMMARSREVVNRVLYDFGLGDKPETTGATIPEIELYFDPVLRENFKSTITNVVDAYLSELDNSMLISRLYAEVGLEGDENEAVLHMLRDTRTIIRKHVASTGRIAVAANATQHNVPAWTIFAIFFMVISLGGNMVKEKANGSFVRLRTMPSSITLVILAKMLLYLIIAVLQVVLIFSFSALIFPFLQLPHIEFPSNLPAFAVVVLMTGLAAVSYSVAIGAFSKSQVQANGFGAISVIIFAALGGIWVPVFLMPENLQKISWFSPLRQSLDAFYTLFLKNGNWSDLSGPLAALAGFILLCLAAALIKFKTDRLI